MLVIGPEHFILASALLYLPYWVALLPLLLMLGLSWLFSWRWRAVAAATLLVYLWPIMGFSIGRGELGAGQVRFMTYNVKAYINQHDADGFDDIAAEIGRYDPDVVVMQDATQLDAGNPARAAAMKSIVGERAVYAFGQYVIASRLPMRRCQVGSIAHGGKEHTLVHCILTAHGQEVDVYTAHFLSPRDGLNALRQGAFGGADEWQASVMARLEQADKLAQMLSGRRRPAILAGDLNAPESSLILRRILDLGFRDAFSSAAWGYGFTHGHSLWPHISTIRIDHILVSRDIGVASCFAGGKDASDHRPVIADLWMY